MPTSSRSDRPDRPLAPAAIAAGAIAFAVLATLNAGGYRYGVSDQAFYVPAVYHQLDPALFPRDWAMLGAQGRFFLVDELFAALVRVSGVGLAVWFAAAQLATLLALYAGGLYLGRVVLGTPLGLVAWMAALTLRHRIAKTGANTLEGYFHPRVLVFGLGLVATADFLRGHRWRPLILMAGAATLHPTTAAMFIAVLTVASIAADTRVTTRLGLAAGVAAAAAIAFAAGAVDLTPMDAAWRDLIATKDYTFPTQWSASTWLTNLAGPLVLLAAAAARARAGSLTARERAVVIGVLTLLLGFLVSLPLIAAGVPLAVQLQTSRVFWVIETIAVLYAVWWLVDRPAGSSPRTWLPRAVAVVLVLTAVLRGVYVGLIESPDRPTIALDLPRGDWEAALAWIRSHTPTDAFVLADPGHAWKFGTAVRIGAARDVYLEDTKDVAMAMYSRTVAHQVRQRIDAVAGFATMDAAAITALATREGLTVLVSERALDLPILHEAGAVRVYRLGP